MQLNRHQAVRMQVNRLHTAGQSHQWNRLHTVSGIAQLELAATQLKHVAQSVVPRNLIVFTQSVRSWIVFTH